MHEPVTFSFLVPTDHVKHIYGTKHVNIRRIENQTNSDIAINKTKAGEDLSSVNITSLNDLCLNKACEEILKCLSKSQKITRQCKNKTLIDLLQTYSPTAAMGLLQNFGVTFQMNAKGSAILKAWDNSRLDDAFVYFDGEIQNRDFGIKKKAAVNQKQEKPKKEVNKRQQTKPKKPRVHVGLDCSKYPKCMNILVLGETGVGKSTFINGLVNHMKFGSIDEAVKSEPEILIESEFTLMDDQFETRVIRVQPPDRNAVTQQQGIYNEVLAAGQSATQKPRAYVFEYTHNGEDKEIRIIDTPGIGDTRLIEYDKENFNNILSFIAEYRDLHAICILMKPNNARETLAFRFCIDELLVHLHKNASRNLLFCFTNTRGTLYKPGDTFPTLKEHLSKLQQDRDITINLKKETLFSFDNESFRFLCAIKQGFNFEAKEKENFSASWTKSVEETARLFDCISSLPVHNTNDTLCLNNTRQLILALSDPLAQMVRLNLTNQKLMEERIEEVGKLSSNGRLLQENLYKEQVVLEPMAIPYPMTVCTAKNCVDHKRLSPAPNAPLETVYRTVCHDHCYLNGVQTETVPNTILQNCACMVREADIHCKQCNCSWTTHMHIRYQLNARMEKIIDVKTQEDLRIHGDNLKAAEDFIAKLEADIAELQKEHGMITNYGAIFAAFLAENSILPYNDSYLDYVNHLIREERNKAELTRNNVLVIQMEKYRDAYQQQVNLIKANIENKADAVRSVEEIHEMVSDLKNLTHSGRVIVQIQDLELRSIRQTKENTETRIGGFLKFGKACVDSVKERIYGQQRNTGPRQSTTRYGNYGNNSNTYYANDYPTCSKAYA